MNNNKKIGKFGEKIAVKYLIKNGYKILSQNHREFSYEIDIIAVHPDGTLVFFEIKTRNNNFPTYLNSFTPEDALSPSKMRKMIMGCQLFIARYPKYLNERKGWQMDLIAVTIIEGRSVSIRHYKNL